MTSDIRNTPYFNTFYKLYHRSDVTYDGLAEAMNVDIFMNAFIVECSISNTDHLGKLTKISIPLKKSEIFIGMAYNLGIIIYICGQIEWQRIEG